MARVPLHTLKFDTSRDLYKIKGKKSSRIGIMLKNEFFIVCMHRFRPRWIPSFYSMYGFSLISVDKGVKDGKLKEGKCKGKKKRLVCKISLDS